MPKKVDPEKWKKTALVAECLGVRPRYLTDLVRRGSLKKGKHYIDLADLTKGARPSYRWNIEAIKRDFLD
jgi:hypothetical protein